MSLLKAFERNLDRGPQFEVSSLKGVVNADIIREQATSSRLDALEKQLDTIMVLTHRVNDLEKRLGGAVKNFNDYADIAKRFQKYFVDLSINVAIDPVQMMPERATIPIPDELKYKGRTSGKPANRSADIVQRRWTIWKAQYESGMSINEIAKDWGCDHGSILYAKSRGWRSSGKGWKWDAAKKKMASCSKV
jgi:hypothetical protein